MTSALRPKYPRDYSGYVWEHLAEQLLLWLCRFLSRVLVITPTCYVCNCAYFLHVTFRQTDSKCVGPMHTLRYFGTDFSCFKQNLVLVLVRDARPVSLCLKPFLLSIELHSRQRMGSSSFLHEAVGVTQSLPGGCSGQWKGSL